MTSVPSFFAEYQRDVDADVRSERQAGGAALYYRYLDGLTGTAVADAQHDGDRALWVITQPGRLRRGAGILAFRGSGAATVRTAATALDVAPTILHALGVFGGERPGRARDRGVVRAGLSGELSDSWRRHVRTEGNRIEAAQRAAPGRRGAGEIAKPGLRALNAGELPDCRKHRGRDE
jgi:hypothetical protein